MCGLSFRERGASAAAALVVVLATAFLLTLGLRAAWRPHAADVLVSVDVSPRAVPQEQPRPAAPVPEARRAAPKGDPAPAGLRGEAAPVAVLPRVIVILPPLPVAAATETSDGAGMVNGAAQRPGPGQAAGGAGEGLGGGGDGGQGGGVMTPARHVRGRLKFSDVPESILGAGQSASVSVRYTVETGGRVTGCSIAATSGIAALDALVCRLIERRFRFRPARDAQGRAIRTTVTEDHSWSVAPDDGAP